MKSILVAALLISFGSHNLVERKQCAECSMTLGLVSLMICVVDELGIFPVIMKEEEEEHKWWL